MRHASRAASPLTRSVWVLCATALCACAIDDPAAPAPEDGSALEAAPPARDISVPVKELSDRFAYVLADQPTTSSYTPDPSYAYNATGGSIQVTRLSLGHYDVVFDSPGGWGTAPIGMSVTTRGSSKLGCSLNYLAPGVHLDVSVICYDRVTHVYADAPFSLLVAGTFSLFPRSAFAFANQPSSPSYAPNPLASYTSGPGSIVITHHAALGDYSVDTGTGSTTHSTFLISEQFFSPGYLCTVGAWEATAAEVRCFDRSGALHDHTWWVMQVEGGRPGRRIGYAWANQPTADSYAPSAGRSYNSSGGAITVTRTSVGHYKVAFAGLQKRAGHTENVQVTPFGQGYSSCNVVNWGNSGGALQVNVQCRKVNGAFKDARFNVLVIE